MITIEKFNMRKMNLISIFDSQITVEQAPSQSNPFSDPNAMDGMLDGLKKNMAMIIPQSVIMAWINFFFSGFVLSTQILIS